MSTARYDEPPETLQSFQGTSIWKMLHKTVSQLRWSAAWLREVQGMRLDAALSGLAHAKRVRRYAAAVEDTFTEAATAEMIMQGITHYEGDGFTAVLHDSKDRRGWRTTDVVEEVIEQETSRQRERHPDLSPRVLRQVVSETMWRAHGLARLEWRTNALRKVGIHPDDFCDTAPGMPSLDLRGRSSYAQSRTKMGWEN